MTNQSNPAALVSELSPAIVESMVCRIAATPLLLEELGDILKPEFFYKVEEAHLALMYRALQGIYSRFHQLNYEGVRGEVERLLCDTQLPSQLTEYLLAEGTPCGLLQWSLVKGTAQIASAPMEQTREMIRSFLQERGVYRPLQQMLQTGMPGDLHGLLDGAIQQHQRIAQIDTDPISGGVPDGRAGLVLDITSTGLAYLDAFMDGGQSPGEAYGFIGPTGVGKTSLACSMAAKAIAQQAFYRFRDATYTPKMVYYVTYEAGRDEIKQRIISASAEIQRDSVKHIDFSKTGVPAHFTSAALGNLHAYERAMQTTAGSQIAGEAERFQRAYPQLSQYLRIIDLSGLGDPRYCRTGEGGIAELVGLIAKDRRG